MKTKVVRAVIEIETEAGRSPTTLGEWEAALKIAWEKGQLSSGTLTDKEIPSSTCYADIKVISLEHITEQ